MNSKVNIAIIDNGINKKLAKNIICRDFLVVDENNNCREDYSDPQENDYLHGTICALLINKYCPECVFSSIRILDQEDKGNIEKIEPALEWCCQNNIKIVNLSLGTTNFKDIEKLNRLINKYAYKGLIIVAAVSNIGYFTYPASYSNAIGVATIESSLKYTCDYVHLGIDAVVPSVHAIMLNNMVHETSLSNSYATPYVSAIVAKKIMEDNTCDFQMIKKYVRSKSHMYIMNDLYNPDWVYKAYIINYKNNSKTDFYFETITDDYENVEQEIDTIIAQSRAELEQIEIKNKNLIYLGKDEIDHINTSGFKWSWHTKIRQIIWNQFRGNGLDVPLIILDLKESLDKYYILSLFKKFFEEEDYNAYVICMEPESVLYKFEYIPYYHYSFTCQNVKNYIEGQIFYKQSDLILWNVASEYKENIYILYPDFDIEIVFDDTEVLIYVEHNLLSKKGFNELSEEGIRDIYTTLVNCLTKEEDRV